MKAQSKITLICPPPSNSSLIGIWQMKPSYLKKLAQIGSLIVAWALLLVGSNTAAGAIRLTVWESGGPMAVYFANGDSLTQASITTADFTVQLDAALTNFTTGSTSGQLTQSITISSTGASATQTLYAYAEVVDNIGSITTTPAGIVATGNATVTSDALSRFAFPGTDPVWGTASIGGSGSPSSGSATTYVNGVGIGTGLHTFPSFSSVYTLPVSTQPDFKYTLTQLVAISGVANNLTEQITVSGSSSVMADKPAGALPAVPEPASLALWGLGVVGLAAFRRRYSAV